MSDRLKNWWQKPCAHAASVSFQGWDPVQSKDSIEDYAYVGIFLPVSFTEGSQHFKRCNSPQELWDFLLALDRSPVETLLKEFNYTGPVFSESNRPTARSADELLSQLF